MNRFKALSLSILVSFLAQSDLLLAQGSLNLAAVPLQTLEHAEDPYSVQYQLTQESKKFSGQIIETDRFRHPVILENNAEFIEFANYQHDGQFWIAKLKKSAVVERSLFHVVRFDAVPGVTAAHTQYRIVFAPGSEIELRSQTSGSGESRQVSDLVVSYEAARPKGFPYSFVDGIEDNYAIVARVVSGQQRLSESLENTTEQYELNLSSDEAMELLLSSITNGAQEKFSRFYDTLYPNCTTEVFKYLDELSSRSHLKFEKFLTVLSNDPIAGPSLKDLKVRGLLGARAPNLKNELLNGEIVFQPQTDTQTPSLGIFPDRLDEKFSLVFHVENPDGLSQAEKEMIKKAEKELYVLIAKVLQSALATRALNQIEGQNLFQLGLLKVNSSIKEFIIKLDQSLPAGLDTKILLYFVPFVGFPADEMTDEIMQGLPARLPFKTYRAVVSKNRDDLHQVRMAPKTVRLAFSEEASRKNLPLRPFHLTGAVLSLHLKKGFSSVRTQIVGSLNRFQKELGIEQGPVRLESLQTISPEMDGEENSSLTLIGLSHKVGDKEPPKMRVDFGRDLGPSRRFLNRRVNMEVDRRSKNYGLFKVEDSTANINRLKSVPYFLGTDVYLGIGLRFPILSLMIDLETLSLSDIHLRVFKPFLGLSVGSPSIDQQFKDGINQKIKDLKEQMIKDGEGSLLDLIFKEDDKPKQTQISNCNNKLIG